MSFIRARMRRAQPTKKALACPGVNEVGREILEKRGVLSQEEIHKLRIRGRRRIAIRMW